MTDASFCAPVFILVFLLLLLFPQYSVEGAADGLLLWFHTVLPALAPAMILTQLILKSNGVTLLMHPFHPLLSHVFSLSDQGAFALLGGMLCGYPVGPSLCSSLLTEQKLSRKEAAYLLALCSYPSPMFLLGYVRQQLPESSSCALLLISVYAPVFLLSAAAKKILHYPKVCAPGQKAPQNGTDVLEKDFSQVSVQPEARAVSVLDSVLYSVSDTMVLIGGYLMLFSILVCFIRHAAWIPGPAAALLCGIAEMTTGIRQICQVFPPSIQLPLCAAAASFGGISGIFQVKSVLYQDSLSCDQQTHGQALSVTSCDPQTGHRSFSDIQCNKNAGFDIRHYIGWKFLHAGFSVIILTVLRQVLPLMFPLHW